MSEKVMDFEGIIRIPIGSLAKYRIEDLYEILQQVCEQLEQLKRTKEWLESAIALKYEERINAKRLRLQKDTGIIHLEDEGFRLTNDIPKKVHWDQSKLAKIANNILSSGSSLDDYVEVYYNVRESKFNSWSEVMRNFFDSARVVKLGKPIYKLTKLTDEVIL